jgi:signal transduction histidine kinase/CheY-like chemotaxis protein
MRELPLGFARLYTAALRSHLIKSGEYPLHQAYELGRRALGLGVGVLDLVLLHHDTLNELMLERRAECESDALAPAAEFLAECLSPFEMTLRGYQQSNAHLSKANADLVRANALVAAAHEQLKTEVAERERVEEALLHAQKLQAVGLLAGGVAHHFNNLLTVVLGNLELARQRVLDEKTDAFLLAAARGAERGAQLTKQLLTFSRQQMLQPRTVDPAVWLADVTRLLIGSLRGDIVVETDVRGAPWLIEVDPSQLDLAILNLAVNARDAMPNGGTLRLSVENKRLDDHRLGIHGDYVVINVSDTGEGVAPDVLPRVFEPFFTTKEGGPGAGLGLSQVHGFVHQSGGAVDMESVFGEGTTIRLYLPATAKSVIGHSSDAPSVLGSNAMGHLLVVDDDVEVADIAAQLLESCGYSVRLAHGAQAALDIMKSGETVDLIFSDIIMPGGMNGVQLAEEVRRSFPKVPILLATGYSDSIAGANAKGLAVITKPYRSEDLRKRIDELLVL